MPHQLPDWVWPLALMSLCGLAVWRGRDEERLAVAGLLANWALCLVVYRTSEQAQFAVLIFDALLMCLYLAIAFRTRRYWPLFAAAFQVLMVLTHLARVADAAVSGWAYLTALLVWSYLGLLTLAYAAWTAPRYADTGDGELNPSPGATRR